MSYPVPPTTPTSPTYHGQTDRINDIATHAKEAFNTQEYDTAIDLYSQGLQLKPVDPSNIRAAINDTLIMKAKRDMEKKRPVYSDLRKTNEGELPYGGRSRAEMQRLANEDSTVAEELAASLSHLAVDEKIAGRPQSALLAEGQAIQVRRKWAATHPTIANHLSESLMNYAFDLSEQERQADAAEATEESIALQRQLLETSTNSDSNPSATKILADSLENLSKNELWRKLAPKHRNFKEGLVSALDDYTFQLSALGRDDDAEPALQERFEVSRAIQPEDSRAAHLTPTVVAIKHILAPLGLRRPGVEARAARHRNPMSKKDEDTLIMPSRSLEDSTAAPAAARNAISIVYCSTYTPPKVTTQSSTSTNSTFIQQNSGSGCSISVHDSVAAASWIEDNWDDELLTSVRTSGCLGPVGCMLSPDEPALALFQGESSADATVLDLARDLAERSKYPIMLRDASDYPNFSVLYHDAQYRNERVHLSGNTDNSGDGTEQEPSQDREIFREERNPGDPGDDERRPPDVQADATDQISSALKGLDLQLPGGASFGAGGGGGDGGGDGAASAVDGNWDSPNHSTKIKLRLKIDEDRTCTVTVGYDFQFSIRPTEKNATVNLDSLHRSIFRPEVITRVDFNIVTPPRRAAIDRSYASIGFAAHRRKSISHRHDIPRGYEAPGRIHSESRQIKFEKGIEGTAGWSQNSPTVTGTLHARKTETRTVSAMDDRVMPKCCVHSVPGDEWNAAEISYSSYNYQYEWQDKLLNYARAPGEAMEFKVGMGINLRPQGPLPRISFVTQNQTLIWVSDPKSKSKTRGILVLMNSPFSNIKTPDPQYIDEEQEIDLERRSPVESEGHGELGTISLAIAQVEKPAPRRLSKLLSFNKPVAYPVELTMHEYLARGWDVDQEKWRRVIGWPDLDKDFRVAYETEPVWRLNFPVNMSAPKIED